MWPINLNRRTVIAITTLAIACIASNLEVAGNCRTGLNPSTTTVESMSRTCAGGERESDAKVPEHDSRMGNRQRNRQGCAG